jgi:hypothetical protein
MQRIMKIFCLLSLFLCFLAACQKKENPVYNYFKNAEPQYDSNTQKQNIITALNDILNLSEDELKAKRYKDYSGKDQQWDLPKLIIRHFVPDSQGKSFGNNFYHDVKSEKVKDEIVGILKAMK